MSQQIADDLLKMVGTGQAASGTSNIANDLLTMVQGQSYSSASYGNSSASYGVSSASYGASSASASAGVFFSELEQLILRSVNPIEISETEELTVIGQSGIWVNRQEVQKWRGDIPITEYRIHEDNNPQIITKKVQQSIEYVQELAIRYLRPPTPPAAGEIVITQEANIPTGPAPPLIIRQQPARAATPEPLVIREAPPQPPAPIGPKRITISGKRIPPPPRKVVIERLAPLPAKPQNVIIERWLPYADNLKRRVVFQPAAAAAEVANPRNVIVQWEAPEVNIRKEVKFLGVIRADPVEYVQRYGAELVSHTSLPQYVLDINTPAEVGPLAAGYRYRSVLELEGQLEGFQYINLESEGMVEYRDQLLAKGIRDLGAVGSSSVSYSAGNSSVSYSAGNSSVSYSAVSSSGSAVSKAASQIFEMIDKDHSGEISVEEAESIVLKMNNQLKRSYGETEVRAFFTAVSGGSPNISKVQFLEAMEKLTNA